jgi:2'-5' RNA ligase
MSSDELASQLKRAYVGSTEFQVHVHGEAQFGYKKRKTVNVVEASELMKLEGQTRRTLHAHKAWVVDEADKTRGKFRPHVTAQSTMRVHEGDTFGCDKLYIVEQKGDYKQISSEVSLYE